MCGCSGRRRARSPGRRRNRLLLIPGLRDGKRSRRGAGSRTTKAEVRHAAVPLARRLQTHAGPTLRRRPMVERAPACAPQDSFPTWAPEGEAIGTAASWRRMPFPWLRHPRQTPAGQRRHGTAAMPAGPSARLIRSHPSRPPKPRAPRRHALLRPRHAACGLPPDLPAAQPAGRPSAPASWRDAHSPQPRGRPARYHAALPGSSRGGRGNGRRARASADAAGPWETTAHG